MKLSKKGQITIPQKIREKLGLEPGDELEFVENDNGIILRRTISEQAFDDLKGRSDQSATKSTDEHLEVTRGQLD